MAKIKPKKADAKEIFNGFYGIASESSIGGTGASDIRNFRILSDGSLQKRCGWKRFASFSEKVRGFWQGSLNGISRTFAVAEDTVYRLENDSWKLLRHLTSESGRVRFFTYRKSVFLLDGVSLWTYHESSDSFEEAVGYAPLYGYNWHPDDMGTVNEPLNLLSKHLRVHYYNTTGGTSFYLPFYAEKIDQVRVNGILISDYELLSTGRNVSIASAATASSVEIAFTLSIVSDTRDRLKECAYAFTDTAEEYERLALYGSLEAGNLLFCAAQVDDNMLNASKAVYPYSDALYFKENTILTLGDAEHPITSLFCNHDRILAFHSAGAYAVYFAKDTDTVEAYSVLRGIGCDAKDASLYLEGDPVVVNTAGIFRLHSTAGDPNEFTVSKLSNGIAELCGADFAQSAVVCEDTSHRELWFCSLDANDGKVWVYQTEQKQWVIFDNISPTFFFRIATDVGFASDQSLCLFDEALMTDSGAAFNAVYTTAYLTFSDPEAIKRALRLTLCAHSGGNPIEIEVIGDKTSKRYLLSGEDRDTPELFDLRIAMGRFTFLQIKLCDTGSARSSFYRLALFANL